MVRVAGVQTPIHGLLGRLSRARARYVWLSRVMDQLAWQNRHVAPVRRYSAVPLWVRIDKLKTAVASGAGPTAVLTRPSRRLRVPGLHDRSLSRLTGSDKIKIELRVLSARVDFADLFVADWPDLAAFQGALDQRSEECHQTRQCPTTGSSIADGHMAERRLLQALPTLDELFDGFVARRASRDWLVSFEGRRYSRCESSASRAPQIGRDRTAR